MKDGKVVKAAPVDQQDIRFWRVHSLRNLELSHVAEKVLSVPKHVNEGFEISVIERGATQLRYRGTSHFATAGNVLVINPGEVHAARAVDERGWSYRTFFPTAADVQDAASSSVRKRLPIPWFSTPVIDDGYLAGILATLHRLLEVPNSALAQESYSIWVAAQLVTRHATGKPQQQSVGKEHRAIRLACDFIQAHAAENVTLARIAALTGLSSFHLIRVFGSHIGMPPHAYLNQVRVNRARKLLSEGKSLARVATETGFVDQSHLSRHFKRQLGITPGQYAQATRRSIKKRN